MKIIKQIPNTITSLNLLCGVIGIAAAFYYRLDLALYFMIAAAILDFFDGFTARLIGAYSEIGKELDSLADLISFGLLPATMLHRLMIELGVEVGFITFIPFIIVVFSAIRLAKFNLDSAQKYSFIGLATPAAAMLCGSLVYFIIKTPESFLTNWASGFKFIPTLSLIISFLLVSKTPMFSLKFKKDEKSNTLAPILALLAVIVITTIVVLFLSLNWSLIMLVGTIFYILINYALLLFRL